MQQLWKKGFPVKIVLRVSIFSDVGNFEGIFNARQSDEFNCSVNVSPEVVVSIPWNNISRAVFFSERIIEQQTNLEKVNPNS